MLSTEKRRAVDQIQATFTRSELVWLQGFISGSLFSQGQLIQQVSIPAEKKAHTGELICKINLHDIGSTKQTHHLEILAEDIDYEPGDSISFSLKNNTTPSTGQRYPLSSSPEAHSGELHLTTAGDIEGLTCGDPVDFYIHKNEKLRLPPDDKDLIMIGASSGIAPFRSFLAHRDATGANGRNWLFFGEKNFISDFLYQTDLQLWVETGVLNQLNVAFSDEQTLLQHKLLTHGQEIVSWLNTGATLFINTPEKTEYDAIEKTLEQIIARYNNKTIEEAREWLYDLRNKERYHGQSLNEPILK